MREELEHLQKTVGVSPRRHYTTLLDHKDKVREVLLTAMNGGLKAGMIGIPKQGGVLHRKDQYAPPPFGRHPHTLEFTRSRELVEEGTRSSLTEGQMLWKQAPEKTPFKKKGAPSTEGKRTGHLQGRASAGGGRGSTLMAFMLERGTPPGMCDFA